MVFEGLFEQTTKAERRNTTSDPQGEVSSSQRDEESADSPIKPKQKSKKKKKKRKDGTASHRSDHHPCEKGNLVGGVSKTKHRPQKRPRYQPPSQEALDLSARLKELSSKKRLQEALDLYWDHANDSIRDCHHTCVLVDCAARCGAIHEGEKAINQMKESGASINVETKTALLKGYAHAGLMQKATILFREMYSSGDRRDRPNVRSLNTLLRGCLWSAAAIGTDSNNVERLWGGVVTSEEAWKACWHISKECFDSSSYEYYIVQLCYSLQLDEAEKQIKEMKRHLNIEAQEDSFSAEDPRVLESLAFVLVALARGYTLLGQYEQASATATQAIVAAISANKSSHNSQSEHDSRKQKVYGGKRAWKESDTTARRKESNSLYRSHRVAELQEEAKNIHAVAERADLSDSHLKDLCRSLLTQLLYFSGGGTTGLENADEEVGVRETAKQLLCSSAVSFGLLKAYRLGSSDKKAVSLPISSVVNTKLRKKILQFAGLGGKSVLTGDGFLDLPVIFAAQGSRPLDIELGSGFGDWIVGQARREPERNYIAVELRSDRVAQTFARIMMGENKLKNVCCVGAEASSFLRDRVRKKSVSTIFVNHPEPPTQTYGSHDDLLAKISNGGDEPGHMLSSNLLIIAGECLKPGSGRLIIVTDNRFYGRLICATLVKVMKSRPRRYKSVELTEKEGFVVNETFEENVCLYEGQPGNSIGHANSSQGGQSYFDRLWKSGAGNHADRNTRFLVGFTR